MVELDELNVPSMPNWSSTAAVNDPKKYRFGMNEQERDTEFPGGSTYYAEFWEYDARKGIAGGEISSSLQLPEYRKNQGGIPYPWETSDPWDAQDFLSTQKRVWTFSLINEASYQY
jgi:hypothetical protein